MTRYPKVPGTFDRLRCLAPLAAAVIFLCFCLPAQAAIEGEYTENETAIERDEEGAILNSAGDVRRDIPSDRKMYRIGSTNVVKAEGKDAYTSRAINQIKKETEKKLNQFEQRISEMETIVQQLKNQMKTNAVPRKSMLAPNPETSPKGA